MTPEQLTLVGRTVAAMDARPAVFAAAFYDRFLALAPDVGALVADDPAGRRRGLDEGVALLVGALGDLASFVPRARLLGARYHRRGFRPDHYEAAEAALLAALADVIGPAWDQPTRLAWQRLSHLVGETMLEGAAAAALVGEELDVAQGAGRGRELGQRSAVAAVSSGVVS